MIKVFEAFSGIGTQRMALRNIGVEHEVVAISDIDEFAIKSYAAIHDNDKVVPKATDEEMQAYLEKRNIPLNDKGVRKVLKGKKLQEFYEACVKSNNLGDISKVDPHDIPDHDLFTYSFPCFTGDSLVLTDTGYKRIDEINIGDMVLTHTNQYKKVTNVFNQGVKDIVNVKGMAIHNIKTTENHKFLTRKRYRLWNNDKRSYDRMFHEPQWVEAKDLTRSHYLGLAINQKSELPVWNGYTNSWNTGYGFRTHHTNFIKPLLNNHDFWWLMGRYVADGWHRSQGGITITVPDNKLEEFENKVNKLFNYSISKERTANKVHIPIKELQLFTEQFGYYAHGKKISPEVLNLPVDLLKSFIEGYFSGDGSYSEDNKIYKCTTTSEELIYGIGQCIAKVYHRPYSIYKTKRPDTCVIEGRTVNQRDTYSLAFKQDIGEQDKAFYEDGYIWFPFNSLEHNGKETVYDIEVEDDHSFTVFNTIVHNCQSISVAGKQKGFEKDSGTRSSLLWECEKVINVKRPKYLLMENVKALVSKKFIKGFESWLELLEGYGYTNYWQVLNAKDYGVPQNRERVFVVSILGDHDPYKFPEKKELTIRLKDVLEHDVDESYYLDDDRVSKLTFNFDKVKSDDDLKVVSNTSATNYNKANVYHEDGISPTIAARDYKGPNQALQVGQYDTDTRTNSNRFRTYSPKGVSPTISTMGGGGLEPCIIDEPKRLGGIFDNDGKTHQAGAVKAGGGSGNIPKVIKNEVVPEVIGGVGEKNFGSQYRQGNRIYDVNKIATALTASPVGNAGGYSSLYGDPESMTKDHTPMLIKNGTKKGYLEAYNGDGIDTAYPESKTRRGRVQKNMAHTITTDDSKAVVIGASRGRNPENPSDRTVGSQTEQRLEINKQGTSNTITTVQKDNYVVYNNLRIRKLTPKECWRLMGCSDEDFHKAEQVNSNSQLYKQAGNAIVVDVLEGIFSKLFGGSR